MTDFVHIVQVSRLYVPYISIKRIKVKGLTESWLLRGFLCFKTAKNL